MVKPWFISFVPTIFYFHSMRNQIAKVSWTSSEIFNKAVEWTVLCSWWVFMQSISSAPFCSAELHAFFFFLCLDLSAFHFLLELAMYFAVSFSGFSLAFTNINIYRLERKKRFRIGVMLITRCTIYIRQRWQVYKTNTCNVIHIIVLK